MRSRMVLIAAAAWLVTAGPSAARDQPAADPTAAFRAMVEEVRAELMKPGDRLKGWNVGGADPSAELGAIGPDRNYFLIEDDGSRDVSILTDRRISDFAPAAWRAVDSYGSAVAYAEKPSVGFTALGLRYVIAGRAGSWRESGLDCTRGPTHAILYERTDIAESDMDRDMAIGMFRLMMLAVEGQTLCSRADGNARNGWRMRYLLPDGRGLPELNKQDIRMTIVAAAPVDTLIKGKKILDPAPEAGAGTP